MVPPVLNQGACSSCYAFSAAAVISAAVSIATQQPAVQLSPKPFVDCFYDFAGCGEAWRQAAVWWAPPLLSAAVQRSTACCRQKRAGRNGVPRSTLPSTRVFVRPTCSATRPVLPLLVFCACRWWPPACVCPAMGVHCGRSAAVYVPVYPIHRRLFFCL